jgi:hypothetical protein
VRRNRGIVMLALLAPLVWWGCSSGSSSGGGSASGGTEWPDRDGGVSGEFPAVVETGRIVFQSETGEACCVAVDPAQLGDRGLAVLDDVPVGLATVTVAGFPGDFAPAVPGIFLTCSTDPPMAAMPCDLIQAASAAFESAPLEVEILAGMQTDIGVVPLESLPFVFEKSPEQGTSNQPPIDFVFTVVDAVNGVRPDSVMLEMVFEIADDPDDGGDTAPSFRVMTKRVPIELSPCDDTSAPPCSPDGDLDLVGFVAAGTAPRVPEGKVEARITAENLSNPSRSMDFRYPVFVLPTATKTFTPGPATTPTPQREASGTGSTGTEATAGGAGIADPTPTARNLSSEVVVITVTPTATATPGEDPASKR